MTFRRGFFYRSISERVVCRLPSRLAVAAAAATATAAAAAVTAGPGLVDRQVAAAELLAVELLDGGLALLARRHLDEAEAARAARVAILDDVSRLDRPRL